MPEKPTREGCLERALARLAVLVGLIASGCSSTPGGASLVADAWPRSWEAALGRTLTLEGSAANAKSGALLLSEDGRQIWIDGLDEWPSGLADGDRDERLRVTGTVILRHDLPAFVAVPGEPERAGIPVESEGELEAARVRYLLANASWVQVVPGHQ